MPYYFMAPTILRVSYLSLSLYSANANETPHRAIQGTRPDAYYLGSFMHAFDLESNGADLTTMRFYGISNQQPTRNGALLR